MNYFDGKKIKVGDIVKLGSDEGVIIGIIDESLGLSDDFMEQWGYLKKGFFAEFSEYGLIHYKEAELDLQLVRRAD